MEIMIAVLCPILTLVEPEMAFFPPNIARYASRNGAFVSGGALTPTNISDYVANQGGTISGATTASIPPSPATEPVADQSTTADDTQFPIDTLLRGNHGFLIEKDAISDAAPDQSLIAKAITERKILIFQATPEDISENNSASWNQHSIIGRAEPIFTYAHSGPRKFGLALKYWIDAREGSSQGDTRSTLIRRINYIRAMVCPQYGTANGGYDPPKVFKLFYGELFAGINVLVESYNFALPEDVPVLVGDTGNTPMILKVSLDLVEANTDDELIARVAGYRGY